MFIRTGSAINLTCTISQSAEPPPFVFWYHNDKMINYMPQKGEITLHKTSTDTTVSRLYIRRALVLDSGNYTCGPANAEPVSISVHVVAGKNLSATRTFRWFDWMDCIYVEKNVSLNTVDGGDRVSQPKGHRNELPYSS